MSSAALAGLLLGLLGSWRDELPARLPAWLRGDVDLDAAVVSAVAWNALLPALLALPLACLAALLERLPGRGPAALPAPMRWPWMAASAWLAASALDTVLHNDGVTVLPGYRWWAPVMELLAPLLGALLAWAAGSRRAGGWLGPLGSLATGAGLAALVLVGPLPETYRGLLGHAWLGAVAALGSGLHALLHRPATPRALRALGPIALGAALGLGAAAGALATPTRLLLQRFAFPVGTWFDAVPLTAWLHRDLRPADAEPPTPLEAQAFERELTDPDRLRAGEPRGRHVVLLVLESTRADLWGDPSITPRFAQLRRRGTWARRAVAQYPATPLAYGALFTSQPPTVLARSPFWAHRRLFDALRDRFDALHLSKPADRWFDRSAITAFFARPGDPIGRHRNSAVALRALRRRIETLRKGQRLFAWVHLYEPHAPYRPPPPFAPTQRSLRARYEGELRYVDHHLGEFLAWFDEQPIARETLLVLVGDHGEGLGERVMGRPFVGHHVHVHASVSLVPLYLQGPGIEAGRVVEEPLLQQLDVMPTIFDFLGRDLPRELLPQGSSALRLLRAPRRRPLVTEAFNLRGRAFFSFVERARKLPPRALRERFRKVSEAPGRRYAPKIGLQLGWDKLVLDRLLRRAWLYDLRTDPQERRELGARRPRRLRAMRAMLRRWQRRQRWVADRLDGLLEAAPEAGRKPANRPAPDAATRRGRRQPERDEP